MAEQGLTQSLAAFASRARFEELPATTIEVGKRLILDCLGCGIAASTLGEGCAETVAVMQRLGGSESTILGFGSKTASHNAAFANGALVHALNYDAYSDKLGHTGVPCLAAPLAMAEACGNISGRDFLVAAVVAGEISSRITMGITRTGRQASEKFLSGQLLSVFGAAAGAGRIARLDPDQMRSALGLALMQMSGSRQIVLAGDPPAKAIYGAFPNQAGVTAALLAQSGLVADCEILGEPAGLYSMIYGGRFDADAICEGLGTSFAIDETEFKPWPTSNRLHPFVEAAIALRGTVANIEDDIRRVEIVAHARLHPWCHPIEVRRRPSNAAAAANSIPFCVGKALAHGEVTLADFTRDGLRDRRALAIADRTTCVLRDDAKGATVRFISHDGQAKEMCVEAALGHSSRPLSKEHLLRKFEDCCRHSVRQVDAAQVRRLIAMVDGLDEIDNIALLTAATCGSGSPSCDQ